MGIANTKNSKVTELENDINAIINTLVESKKSDVTDVRILKKRDLLDKFATYKSLLNTVEKKDEKFDIAIFTIVPVEFEYANKLLKFMKAKDKPDFFVSNIGYHKFDIKVDGKEPLKAVITLVGTAGDVNCSITCCQFFNEYDCDLAILCGISAGVESEISMYSTVIGDNIVNYEHQRIEPTGVRYRTIPNKLDFKLNQNLTNLIKQKSTVNSAIQKAITKFNDKVPKLAKKIINNTQVKIGMIASGGKLLADGKTIQTLRENIQIEKSPIAFEMEGSGFVPACEAYEKKWMVFRGVSDFGDANKSDKNNKVHQKFAVISAVTTMMYYLKNHHKVPITKENKF